MAEPRRFSLGWRVREAGSRGAPAVVFLHGAGLSGRMWEPHTAEISAAFHSLAPDLPGCGGSRGIEWTTLQDAADDVARLIRERVPDGRARVVGISVGGSIAHTLVARHPDRVEQALIDGSGVLSSPRDLPLIVGLAVMSPFLHSRAVIGLLRRSVGDMPAEARADLRIASQGAFRRCYTQALRARATDAETLADVPMLLVAGELERTVRDSNAALAAVMPQALARYVPGLGHGWLGRRLDLHVKMVATWLLGSDLPAELVAEPPAPAAVRRLRRIIGASA